MEHVNIHAAKTHLSKLVERAAAGETIILAKGGKPRAKLVPIETTEAAPKAGKRDLGWLKGQYTVPQDWKGNGWREEIDDMFFGNPNKPA